MSLRLAIGLLSGAAIAYELLLMRLFSIALWNHFAYMVISLALLGYGASGALLTIFRSPLLRHFDVSFTTMAGLFGLSTAACFAAAQRLRLNPLEFVWSGRQVAILAAVYLMLAIPFVFAGGAIGLALARFRESIHRIYRADLLGAAVGAAGVIAALFWLRPEHCLRLIGLAGGLAAVTSQAARSSRTQWLTVSRAPALALAAAAIAAPLLWPSGWLEPLLSEYKALSKTLTIPGTEILAERSSPLGALVAVRSKRVPFRMAPGLSLAFRGEIPDQIVVFGDGEVAAVVNRAEPSKADPLAYLDHLPTALPFHLGDLDPNGRPPRVALLDSTTLQLALRHRTAEIHVIETNPQIFDLLTGELADFAGSPFAAPKVRIQPTDPRGFLTRKQPGFEIISLDMGGGGAAASTRSLTESYLLTLEGFATFMNRLTAEGVLAIGGELASPPRTSLKLLASAAQVLERSGRDPLDHVAAIRSWDRFLLLVRESPFGPADLRAIRAFCDQRQFDLIHLPGMTESESNRYHLLDGTGLFRSARAILGPDRDRFLRDYKFRVAPATDDRPYFFQFFRWRTLPELFSLRERGGAQLIDLGYLLLVATLVQAALAGLLVILLPLYLTHSTASGIEPSAPSARRVGFYFLCLGLAFLFLEIALIQRLTLFLAEPLIAAAVVLAGFLFFAGMGAGAAPRLEQLAASRSRDPIRLAIFGIVLLAAAYLLCVAPFMAHAMAWPVAVKVPLALGGIAPLAFFLGLPFPLGLRRLAVTRARLIPWAWGVNGWASVLSAVLATLLATHFGFRFVVAVACCLYLLAGWLAPERRPVV